MFDLDREIDAWCRAILDNHCASSVTAEELKDHLYCLVEEQTRAGKSEEEAFVAAIKQMGNIESISAEYAKNSTLLQKIAAYDRSLQRRVQRRFTSRQLQRFQIVWGLLFLGLTLASKLLWGDTAFQENFYGWLFLIWILGFSLAASDTARCEIAWIKRKLGYSRAISE